MPTPAQEALADAILDLAAVHGMPWTFGGSSFVGVASALKPSDPRMIGATDRLFEVRSMTVSLPTPYPRRGDEIAREGLIYRVVRIDHDASTAISTLLVSVP